MIWIVTDVTLVHYQLVGHLWIVTISNQLIGEDR